MCIRICIFNFKKHQTNKQKSRKQRKLKKKRGYLRKISGNKSNFFLALISFRQTFLIELRKFFTLLQQLITNHVSILSDMNPNKGKLLRFNQNGEVVYGRVIVVCRS